MAGYYDIVLGVIPLALAGISLALVGLGVDATTAIPLASLVPVTLIGHAMFVRAPVDPVPSHSTHDVPAGDVTVGESP